ncbi:hypothetical protein RSK20926_21135 [Roseobacter sp. SK209-2-6]|uniref:DMT family transporter n=1 Tax=Roseobacter sp. SK209-2-6 TaxID=388739 RepID=UPI0000F3E7F5|nr:DMT family transporter [Roseobacter sp. SK209-2-6]EBA16271.1 hypothetical protein RSK20926_21135 [Roseobacter sp. SK209-2-6]
MTKAFGPEQARRAAPVVATQQRPRLRMGQPGQIRLKSGAILGGLLVLLYTGTISAADGITKLLAQGYAPAQLYVFSGAIVAGLCLLLSKLSQFLAGRSISSQTSGRAASAAVPNGGAPVPHTQVWRTNAPMAMLLRSIAALLAAVCFFYAFRLLPFAQVFLFIGLMPLMAGVLSGWILKERVAPGAWAALLAGFAGVFFLFSNGGSAVLTWGHPIALLGAFCGTCSMILARHISRHDSTNLPQVLYPNLLLCLVMLPVLPFVWQDMPLADFGWVLAYAVLLFAARWLAVVALRLLQAHVVTALMNLQFVWMLVIGALVFGEQTTIGTSLGGFIVITSGLFLLWQQLRAEMQAVR